MTGAGGQRYHADMRYCFALLALTALLLVAGCGGSDEFQLPETQPGAAAGPAYDPSTATATLSGRILFEGTAPEMPFLDMGGDFYCQRSGAGLMSADASVTEDGTLAHVIVYVRSGHDVSLSYPAPSERVLLDQVRCVYTPRVLTLMTGQELLIRNSDATVHNVHADAGTTTLFNFGQARAPREDIEVFAEPGMPIHIGCDLHRWMDAYLGVFDHPFHTTSGDTGTFSLDLPPGAYQVVAWHERYGEQVTTVELADGESAEIDFTFDGRI